MKAFLRVSLISAAVLFLVAFASYRIWFHNPYEDTLRFDARAVFSEETSSDGLLLRNVALQHDYERRF